MPAHVAWSEATEALATFRQPGDCCSVLACSFDDARLGDVTDDDLSGRSTWRAGSVP
jgi:hypothetical protein